MTAIRASALSYARAFGQTLFDDVSFHLTDGFCGLVGENGAGKTTLLQLIEGTLSPTSGTLLIEPRDALIRHCPQRVDQAQISEEIARFAASESGLAHRLRGALSLHPDELQRWPMLSPGERKRFQIGAALLEEPDVLLLDEPTNHLDEHGRALLVNALSRFRNLGVLVSHDRALLAELTTSTLRLHHGRATHFSGSYEAAKETWGANEHALREEHDERKRAEKTLQRRLEEKRRALAAATANLSSKHRAKGPRDHDGRGALAKGRAESAERSLSKQAGVLRQKANRAEDFRAELVVEKSLGRSVFVAFERAPRDLLFRIDRAVIHAGERVLLRDVRLSVRREDRIWIRGKNGCGKSTLLRALRDDGSVPRDRILFVAQETSEAEASGLVSKLAEMPADARGRALSLVAALGLSPDVLMRTKRPSPGEARKAVMAAGLASQPWVVVLDEPTNHLDIDAIERLEAALSAYPGALVIVTHDVGLAERLTTTTWLAEEGRVKVS